MKAKFGVVGKERFLAGEHQTLAALDFCLGDHEFQKLPGAATAAVVGVGVHAEDHLPAAVGVVQRSVVVHFIPQVRLVCHHAVDEADDFVPLRQKPEVVGIEF